MTWSVDSSGVLTATVGTETTLSTPTTPATYMFSVDTVNMALGDLLELRVYDMVDGSNYRQMWKGTYQHVQVNNAKVSWPIAVTTQAKFTLKQTVGTGRAFQWSVRRDVQNSTLPGIPDVNVKNWGGTIIPTPTAAGIPDVNVFNYGNMPAVTDGGGLPQVDVAYINGFVANSSLAQVGVNVVSWSGALVSGSVPPDAVFTRNGTAQAGGASTITLDAGASAVDNFYQGQTVFIRSGTGAGQADVISSYVGATKVATIATPWGVAPDSTSVFSIAAFGGTGGGTANANVIQWNGSAVAVPATAGVPDVNIKNVNNIAATSVTAVSANLGTAQPLNFTGTAGSALVKSDMVDVAGAAVSTSSAQIGVNAVNWAGGAIPAPNVTGVPLVDIKYTLGTLSPAAAGYVGVDWAQVTNKTSTVGLTGTTIGTVTTYTGNTPQTGDSYARLGAPAGASVSADIAAVRAAELTAAQIASGVWTDTTAGDFTTAGSIGKTVVNGVTLGTGITINGYTGNTPQTGDSYARLGAPAGASVSVDVAAIKSDTAAAKASTAGLTFTVGNQVDANVLDWKSSAAPAMTGDSYARLGAPAGASVSADIAAVKSDIDSGVGLTLAAKQGVADTLLDRDMSAGADSGSPSVRTVRQALRFLRNRWVISSGVVTVYKEDDATSSWTSTLTTDPSAVPITANDPAGP